MILKLKTIYYKIKKNILFLFPDHQYDETCKQLEIRIPELICVINKTGRVKFITSTAKKLLGYEINTRLKKIFFEMYGSYIRNLYLEQHQTYQKTSYLEFPIKNSKGLYIWLKLNLFLIKVKNEDIVIITAIDGSQKRKIFEDFDEQSISSKILAENLRVGYIMADSNDDIVLINQVGIDTLGFNLKPEHLIGKNCFELLESASSRLVSPEAIIDSTIKILNKKTEVLGEVFHLKDGRVLERSYFPFKNSYDSDFCIWQIVDITTSYRAQDIIKESEKKYRGIFENLEFGVVEVDTAGFIIHPSANFCKMIEYPEQLLIGQCIDNFIVCNYNKTNLSKLLDLPQGQKHSYEMQLIKNNKERNWVLVNISPILNQLKYSQGSVLFFYDITERKVLEEALKSIGLYAKKAEESEKFFLASMTHELKTPINAILGMSDLLRMTKIDNEQKEYIEILETSTKYLQKLVSDILDISKIESGKVEIMKSNFRLLDFLLEVVKSFEYSLSKKNIKFKIDFNFTPNLEIIADKIILQQILSNLLSNAEKFTHEGSILLSVTLQEETKDSVCLNFKVSDTGIGIADEMREVIFEKFKQLPSVRFHKSQGSGLGLNIVKQLLVLQNSKIEVKSVEGKGSTFYFDLVFEKGNSYQQTITAKPNFAVPPQFSTIKVLIVEDNDLNQQYVAKVLNKWAVNFHIVSSGEEALSKFQVNKYDLILMDLQLPGISGLETAAKMRSINSESVFTIIAMTAVVTSNIESEILIHGINDIIRKPFSIADLYDKMHMYFEFNSLQAAKKEITFHQNLDTVFLKQFYEKDKEYALNVFEYFKNNYLEEFKTLLQNVDDFNFKETKIKLHNIKPAFKMVGLTSIDHAIELILLDKSNNLNTIKDLSKQLDLLEIENVIDSQIGLFKE
jgi:PAS domain S-box-containing protein